MKCAVVKRGPPWPNDEPCFCPEASTSAWFEASTVKPLRPWLYPTPRPRSREGRRVPKKEPVLRCRLDHDQLQCSVAPRPFVCDTVGRNTFISSTGRPWSAWSRPPSRLWTYNSHNSVTSHTQISDLFEGLILRSHPIGSKSKCNRVSQPPRRLWHSITLGLWSQCLRTSKFLSSVDLPRNCMHNVFSFRGSFQKCLYIYRYAPTPWTQTRKPRTVTALATGRWTNEFRTTAITVNKRRKKKRKKLRRSGHWHCSTDRSIQNEMCSC